MPWDRLQARPALIPVQKSVPLFELRDFRIKLRHCFSALTRCKRTENAIGKTKPSQKRAKLILLIVFGLAAQFSAMAQSMTATITGDFNAPYADPRWSRLTDTLRAGSKLRVVNVERERVLLAGHRGTIIVPASKVSLLYDAELFLPRGYRPTGAELLAHGGEKDRIISLSRYRSDCLMRKESLERIIHRYSEEMQVADADRLKELKGFIRDAEAVNSRLEQAIAWADSESRIAKFEYDDQREAWRLSSCRGPARWSLHFRRNHEQSARGYK